MVVVSQSLMHIPAMPMVNPKGPAASFGAAGVKRSNPPGVGTERGASAGQGPGLSPPPPRLRCLGGSGGGAGAGPARLGLGGCRQSRCGPEPGKQCHAVRGAGHQPAGRAAAAGAGTDPVRRHRGHPGQAGGGERGRDRGRDRPSGRAGAAGLTVAVPAAGERDGAERAGHGAIGLGRALRPADRLLHRRGGHGGAEQGAQRPLLRRPDGAAGPRPRAVSEAWRGLSPGAPCSPQGQRGHPPIGPTALCGPWIWNTTNKYQGDVQSSEDSGSSHVLQETKL